MNLSIEQHVGVSIVPVLCGNEIMGTGFFVSPKHILTAGHVISPHIAFPDVPISIKIGDKIYSCEKLHNEVEPDYAILECKDYSCPDDYVLEVVGGKFREKQICRIVGFPLELGNGEDYYVVEVKNVREKKDASKGFDRMVTRIDSFGFYSYSGFSGSPVINAFNKVIGLQTDQLYNTLGYASISSFTDALERVIGKKILVDDALFDETTYGLGKARDFTLSQYEKVCGKFKKGLHVKNTIVESEIKSFFGVGFDETESEIYISFRTWVSRLEGIYKNDVNSRLGFKEYLKDGKISEQFENELIDLLWKKKDGYFFLPSYLRESLLKINKEVSKLKRGIHLFNNTQFIYLRGTAGSGKSHFLYRQAKELSQYVHTYLFQGMDFSENDNPINTINKALGWSDDKPLEELNRRLDAEGRYAVFVIDAINEGAGRSFWKYALPQLKDQISHYNRLKLIVSIRTMSDDEQLNLLFKGKWYPIEIDGFQNREQAFKEFFEKYGISDNYTPYLKIDEFQNPLFMKIFCETYNMLSLDERRNAMRIPIYRKYLNQRNIEVSKVVDEDPKQNITSRLLLWIANQSVMQYECGNVPRQSVYKIAQRILRFRPWSKSLLFNCLSQNVLREYTSSRDDIDYVDFEYESLGDYFQAGCLNDRKMSDGDKLAYLVNLFHIMKRNDQDHLDDGKIYCFLRAFLSIWNPNERIWKSKVFQNGELTSILLSSLHCRNVRDEENTLKSEYIDSILENQTDFCKPELILMNFELYAKGLFDSVHKRLNAMKMHERDMKWSKEVNGLYNYGYYIELLEKIRPSSIDEFRSLAMIETWMLTSSYPAIRNYVARKLKNILTENQDLIITIINSFRTVDDSYIHIGLYEAVYGAIATIDDAKLSDDVSKNLFEIHYSGKRAPQDLMVRHWTLKIFEYTYHLNTNSTVWKDAQPPYFYPIDLRSLVGNKEFDKEDFFGNSRGSKRLNHSLYHWDFSRYIIGTNTQSTSSIFFWEKDKPVTLSFICNAIAYIIKNKYHWNDEIGEYDATVPYQTQMENSVERIGKKYQWLALNEVYAYLCDKCLIIINEWSHNKKFAKVNYPWYVREHSNYDPTLTPQNIARKLSYDLFEAIHPTYTLDMNQDAFIKNGIAMTELYITMNDNNGDGWITLHAYSHVEEEVDKAKRERFVYYNPILVPINKDKEISKWMAKENFYGRWMPERNGSTDFRWNEYPWANSYKTLDDESDEDYTEHEHSFKIAYSAQLQEDTSGMEEDYDYLSTAYMPCPDMMKTMNWHTAERGVIRDSQHQIVAINRCIHGDPMRALVIKKSEIDKYLKITNQMLFYALLGEVTIVDGFNTIHIDRLTGAAKYDYKNGVSIVQPLRKEPNRTVLK